MHAPNTTPTSLRIALPPSLGHFGADRASRAGRLMTTVLGRPVQGYFTVNYDQLHDDLRSGQAAMAWAPPLVCAKAEVGGLPILGRGIRRGAASFRAALVARRDSGRTVQGLKGARAVWTEPEAAAGHLLPLALLRSLGLNPAVDLAEQRFAGSYREALLCVAEAKADLTAIFAPPEGAATAADTGIEEVLPERRDEFSVLAFTAACPNDALVLGMSALHLQGQIQPAVLRMHEDPLARLLLRDVFRIERFDAVPGGTYSPLARAVA